jgi:hypothetical protein
MVNIYFKASQLIVQGGNNLSNILDFPPYLFGIVISFLKIYNTWGTPYISKVDMEHFRLFKQQCMIKTTY